MKLSEFNERKKVQIIQFGESGTGKSIRAASAHTWGPMYIFDFDGKVSSVFEYYKDKPEVLEKIHYGTFDNTGDAFKKLEEIRKDPGPYVTVVWDSWTAWEQLYMRDVMKSNPGFKRMKVNIGAQDITVPDMADYRIHGVCQSEFIPALTSMPTNVIVNCHVQVKMDELVGIDRGLQAVGKLSKTLPKFFPEVHRTIIKSGQYVAQIGASSDWPCKTRMKNLPSGGIVTGDLDTLKDMAMVKK